MTDAELRRLAEDHVKRGWMNVLVPTQDLLALIDELARLRKVEASAKAVLGSHEKGAFWHAVTEDADEALDALAEALKEKGDD